MTFIKGHKQFNSGRTHFKKGVHVSTGTEFKKLDERISGESSPLWRGDNVSKKALHGWVKRRLTRPDKCDSCSTTCKPELSNISQTYKRDLTDWQWLCAKCHRNYDNNAKKGWDTKRKNGTGKFYGNQYTKI